MALSLRAMMGFRLFAVLGLVAALLAAPASAQEREVPYWASLRYDEVRMRVGPSEEYPVEWVYKRKGLPVKVVRVREGWRYVEDPEGDKGWIARSQLDPERSAEPGVVAALGTCREGWCEVDIAGRKGWIQQARLWGTEALPGDE